MLFLALSIGCGCGCDYNDCVTWCHV